MSISVLQSIELITDFEECHVPVKKVFTADDIPAWLESEAYARLMTVLVRCNTAIKGKGKQADRDDDDDSKQSQTTKHIVKMLDQLEAWIDEIPLHTGPQRFGNTAFRDWAARLEQKARRLHEEWLPESHNKILPEVLHYFTNAFGNSVRIDYGSGHELSFLGYLTILRYTGLLSGFNEEDMVFILFERYLGVCRKLQKVYRLEPAGSKGVWGLEDHQFLNFLWGSSQLIEHPSIRPSNILDKSIVSANSASYLFLSSISHINTLKRGPFNEHSPILHNIASTVPNWSKVNNGLLKMYQAEVLEKHPVVQHFWFGGLLPWRKRGAMEELPSSGKTAEDEREASNAGTKAPWANPIATTTAPWAQSSKGLPVTSAPWHPETAVSASRPAPAAFSQAGRSNGLSQSANVAARTLASTGSAAAMSSPMGAISQPYTAVTRSSLHGNAKTS